MGFPRLGIFLLCLAAKDSDPTYLWCRLKGFQSLLIIWQISESPGAASKLPTRNNIQTSRPGGRRINENARKMWMYDNGSHTVRTFFPISCYFTWKHSLHPLDTRRSPLHLSSFIAIPRRDIWFYNFPHLKQKETNIHRYFWKRKTPLHKTHRTDNIQAAGRPGNNTKLKGAAEVQIGRMSI